MTDALFYNESEWVRIAGRQGARLIEELVNRTGGSSDPEMTLGEIVTQVTTINQTVEAMGTLFNQAQQSTTQSIQVINNLQQTITENNQLIASLQSQLSQYEQRINELENQI